MVEQHGVEIKPVLVDKRHFRHLITPDQPVSRDAHLIIDLKDPGRNYQAGEKIEGTVKVVIDEKAFFDAESISIRLNGVEKASFIPETDNESLKDNDIRPVRITETIIDVNYVLHEFPNFMSVEGSCSFPFSIKLPEWLPESVMLKDGTTALAVIYFLTA